MAMEIYLQSLVAKWWKSGIRLEEDRVDNWYK